MPWADRLKIYALRAEYTGAAAIHRACSATLDKARRCGEIPSKGVRDAEVKARDRLMGALDRLSSETEEIAAHLRRR